MTKSKRVEFLTLFAECAASYLTTREAGDWVERYLKSVEHGRNNYREVSAAASNGQNVADMVLLKLLPHADTERNRQRGAWIHTTPAVIGDARQMLERANWVRSSDIDSAASAILRFVYRCTIHPEHLRLACAEFAAHDYIKGLHSAMLSPIINAQHPEEFALMNRHVRTVAQYFSTLSISAKLIDYPDANNAINTLVASLADDMLRISTRSDITPALLFELFAHWLVASKRYFKRSRTAITDVRYWKISPGNTDEQWRECREGNFVSMRWPELGDVAALTRVEFNKRCQELLAKHSDIRRAMLNQVWRFAHIRANDRIIVTKGKRDVLGTGTVTGSYYFQLDSPYPHRLPIVWDSAPAEKVGRHGWRQTLLDIDKFRGDSSPQLVGDIEKEHEQYRIPDGGVHEQHQQYFKDQPQAHELLPAYTLAQCSDETGFSIEQLSTWVRSIERKGQAIFFGSPGTGKTFLATRLARHLVGGGDGLIDLVQFHPTYAYEDFIQGIRPQPGPGGGLEYPLVPGRFLEFCQRAEACNEPSVMIIDEINRANLPRVFGELMYLLEYRDQQVVLAGGHRFSIPANVRIIGTMNTADRSIALVDHALRRRFAFLELRTAYDVLERYHRRHNPDWNVSGLLRVLTEINRTIGDRHFEVGISYFLRPDIITQIEDLWRTEIESYLEEYFFDQPEKAAMFAWDEVGEDIVS